MGNTNFSSDTIQNVFEKGTTTYGKDNDVYRKDQCGALIYRSSYGLTTPMGREIDHITPVSKGGGDNLGNLRPLQRENNRAKSDGNLKCAKTS